MDCGCALQTCQTTLLSLSAPFAKQPDKHGQEKQQTTDHLQNQFPVIAVFASSGIVDGAQNADALNQRVHSLEAVFRLFIQQQAAQRGTQTFGTHDITHDLAVYAPLFVYHGHAQNMIKPGWCFHPAETKGPCQGLDICRSRTKKFPVAMLDAVLGCKGCHGTWVVKWLIESNAYDVELIVSQHGVQAFDRFVESACLSGANFKAAGIN